MPSRFASPTRRATSSVSSSAGTFGLGEDQGFWRTFSIAATEASARGNLVRDARIVALMRQYGVGTIVTRDRDFRRFDGVRVRDPYV